MFYTGIDPTTMKPVEYTAKTAEDKHVQRALLQYRVPHNAEIVRAAYQKCHIQNPPVAPRPRVNGQTLRAKGDYPKKKF
jgi:hypothetical protein